MRFMIHNTLPIDYTLIIPQKGNRKGEYKKKEREESYTCVPELELAL